MANAGGGATGPSSSSSPLDGAFLLQILRNPPQSHHQQQQQSQPKPLPFLPHEALNPQRDPAVSAVVPTYPSSPHSLLRPQDAPPVHFSPPVPSFFPPVFSRDHQRAPPGFGSSPPVYRGDLLDKFATNHWRGDAGSSSGSGSSRNFDSWKDRGWSSADRSNFVHRPHGVSGNRRDVNHNVYYNQREGDGQSSLHLQQRELVRIHGGQIDVREQHNQQLDQFRGDFGRKNGLFEEFVRERSFEYPDDDFGGRKNGGFLEEFDDLGEQLEESLVVRDETSEGHVAKTSTHLRSKDVRLDLFRGHNVSSQRARMRKRELQCRHDIDNLTPLFLAIYKSLIPADEEKGKQKQLLHSLAKLVNKEWPNARLHLYGSCANSFGVSKSDIDLCLAIDAMSMSKSDILLKLADILQSGNLQNVQALTHARVPIVKMMDPVTGISCDICVNNLLAVANTKLLRDYAQIDERLRQLAFIVKHWAKSRGVNETYRGTLSSYAYVLMCINFLQQRKPAILPCLQEMEPTYVVDVDGIRCAYFDQVDRLRNFGTQNNESVAQLLWGFFHYWAYYHDYPNDVICVRTGRNISKRAKDWTRRIGNDRHLICIEDPFETSHDLGRVVDKFSIKILREEFERAADIMQQDANPSVTLFEPYVPRSLPNGLPV